ncbi:MAG: FG-GAP-like repeat-containing protein [Candidatus Hydrothermarchaeaceae archaeon]
MVVGAKAQLFTLDLLLALIPLTIALGMSASAISGVSIQIEDYLSLFSKQRVASDVADVLVKTPGEPKDWSISNMETLGFATHLGEWGCGTGLSNSTLANILDITKISNFQQNPTNSVISSTLQNLSGNRNIRIVVTNSTTTLVDVMGYHPGGVWTVTNSSATIASTISGITDLYVSERPVGIITRPVGTLELQTSFALPGSIAIKSTPAVGDLNGDGIREIVVGSNGGKVYAFYPNGSIIWTYSTNYSNFISSPALVDINNDTKLEVLIGDGDGNGVGEGTLYAIKYDGSGLIWAYGADDDIYASPAVADIDDDGYDEVVFGGMWKDNKLTVLTYKGGIKWSYKSGITDSDRFEASPAIGDLDGDASSLEIVAGTCNAKLYAFEPDGTLRWTFTTAGCMKSSPALYNVDSDSAMEIFVVAGDTLYALDDDTTSASTLWPPISGINSDYSSPAVGDINNDGIPEVIVGAENDIVSAYNAQNGNLLWQYTTGGDVDSSPAIGDVDGDCKTEVVIGSDDGKLYVLNGEDGSLAYNYTTGNAISSSPIIADMDGDGRLEIAFGNDGGNFYIIGSSGSSGGEWQMFHQCLKRAGYYYDKSCAGPLSSSITEAVGEDAISGNLKVYMWD